VSENEKCSTSEMIGEFLRELAVLVLVFVPLESFRGTHLKPWQLAAAICATVVAALAVFWAGAAIERGRP
jgi:hypothetical protein